MPSKWIVESYIDTDGRKPVENYIREVNDKKGKASLLLVIESLQKLGPDLQGTKMDRYIDGPIRELRKDRHRILYARFGRDRYILLTAFLKMTKKTPPDQIRLAKSRFEEYKRKNS